MANATALKVLEDGPRNAVALLTGVLDTSNATLASVIQKSNFPAVDTGFSSYVGFRIDKVTFVVADQLQVTLHWKATTPQIITTLAGQGEIEFCRFGGACPDTGAAGFDGALNLATTGWASGTQTYSILLEMVKVYR